MKGSKKRARYLGEDKYIALYAKIFLVILNTYSTAFLIQGSFLKNWDET